MDNYINEIGYEGYLNEIVGEDFYAMEASIKDFKKKAGEVLLWIMKKIDEFLNYLDKLPEKIAEKIDKIDFKKKFYVKKSLHSDFIEVKNVLLGHTNKLIENLKADFDPIQTKDKDMNERDSVIKTIVNDVKATIDTASKKFKKEGKETTEQVEGNVVKGLFADIIKTSAVNKNDLKKFKRSIKEMKLEKFIDSESNLVSYENLKVMSKMISDVMETLDKIYAFELISIFRIFHMRGEVVTDTVPMDDVEATEESYTNEFERSLECLDTWIEVGDC